MKKLLDNFKKFLSEGQMSAYEKAGSILLYHYAPADEEEITVDPKYFADKAKRSSFTMREYETSTVPRTFWYVDLDQAERMVASGRTLYEAAIPAAKIYDFHNDPEGHHDMHRHPVYGLRKGMEWNEMLEHIRETYDGIYYSTGNMDIVALFVPYDARRVTEENPAPEGN